jgi:hypothetical protein
MKRFVPIAALAVLLVAGQCTAKADELRQSTSEQALKESQAQLQQQKLAVNKLSQQYKLLKSSASRADATSESIVQNRIVLEAARLELEREQDRLSDITLKHTALLDQARSEAIIDTGTRLDQLKQYQLPEDSERVSELNTKARSLLSQLASPDKHAATKSTEPAAETIVVKKPTIGTPASASKPASRESTVLFEEQPIVLSKLRDSTLLVLDDDHTLKVNHNGQEQPLELVQARCAHCRPVGEYGQLHIYYHSCDGRYLAIIR